MLPTAIVPLTTAPTPAPLPSLIEAFLAGRSARTLEAYQADLRDFAAFVHAPTLDAAAAGLLALPGGAANGLAHAYRAHLLERELAPATVNRRLAALRSLVKLARTLGMVPWVLEVPPVKSAPYRDTRGPGLAGVRALLDVLDRRLDAKAKRDRAAVRLLFDLGLRRGEVVALDLADVDLDAGTVDVLGKGRTERERLTLPPQTRAALAAWLEVRGPEPGPLLRSFDHAHKGSGRLTGTSLYRLVVELGDAAGLGHVRPHGLRHAAITSALELTGGDVRTVQRFSRHRDLRVLNRYDDNRQDLAGRVACMVAAGA